MDISHSSVSSSEHCETGIFKRVRSEVDDETEAYREGMYGSTMGSKLEAGLGPSSAASFIRIHPSPNAYTTSSFKPNGQSVYAKVSVEALLNVKRVDQITFILDPEPFFVGEGDRIATSAMGFFIHLWRCGSDGKLVLSQSFAFTMQAEFALYYNRFSVLDQL